MLMIVNPTAGRGRALRTAELVTRRWQSCDRTVEVAQTTAAGDAERFAREAVAAEPGRFDCVVACGGDGTVQEVAQALAELRVTLGDACPVLGLAPAGRCNDFARALSVPADADRIADILLTGTAQAIDLGRVDGRYFCTVVTQWRQWQKGGATVLLSLSADSPAQFGQMAGMAHGISGFQALELNLSCPNIESGALFSHSAQLTSQAVSAVRAATDLPVLVKLAPNVPDVTEIALAAVEAGADALTISNTLPAMKIDLKTRRPVLGAVTGGLSGHGLRPVSLAMVYHASRAVDVPIIGVGGIFSGEHALEFILAGATAVQIGSANLADLWSPFRILDELTSLVSQEGVSRLGDLTGAVESGSIT